MLEIIQTILLIIIIIVIFYKTVPIQKSSKIKNSRSALLDSCALIDGRIVELAKAGFMPADLSVPEFIVAELQLLADGSDSHKRERARFGLEVVQQLQQEQDVDLKIERTKVQANTTDEKLVKLAKKIGADLYTTDFNLNQVASIEGVRVLNVNELSHALRPVALPGEEFEIKVLQAGSNRDQGVGYLDDGTMIVIDNAFHDIGKRIKVEITRTHQTIAGKMLFANKVENRHQIKRDKNIKRPAPKIPARQNTIKETNRPSAQRYRTTKYEDSLFKAIDDSNERKV
jgi:uncharacterized protein YacL